MPNIEKLKKNGQTIYPLTTPKAVVDEYGRKWEDLVVERVGTTIPVGGMLPNTLYNLGTLTGEVTMALAEIIDQTVVNHFFCTFETGENVPTLTRDASITKWYCRFNEAKQSGTKNQAPILSPNKHYEISVVVGVVPERSADLNLMLGYIEQHKVMELVPWEQGGQKGMLDLMGTICPITGTSFYQ